MGGMHKAGPGLLITLLTPNRAPSPASLSHPSIHPHQAMLHKCGVRVYKRVEEAVASSSQLQWHHFDAGVVKVLAELAKLSEEDVMDELESLANTDLKSLQHVPAYLNKRLNNRLWQRRKARAD